MCGVRGVCRLEGNSGACPNSLCVQRYPALGQEVRNDLIELFFVAVNALSVKTKKQRESYFASCLWCGCWLAGDGGGGALFHLWAMISSVGCVRLGWHQLFN